MRSHAEYHKDGAIVEHSPVGALPGIKVQVKGPASASSPRGKRRPEEQPSRPASRPKEPASRPKETVTASNRDYNDDAFSDDDHQESSEG